MSVRFYNIRNDEEVVAETEPQISALWFSSDKGPNVMQGQDFGWRLAPEVVVEIQEIMSDPSAMQNIANRFRMMVEDLRETDVLTYISNQTDLANAPIADQSDYVDAYNERIKKLKVRAVTEAEQLAEQRRKAATTEQTTESLADMEKRAELLERIAKAQAATPTEPPKTTTSTTTKA